MASSSSAAHGPQLLKPADRQRINALPTRSRTHIFVKYRDSLRSHKTASRSLTLSQTRDFRAQKNLLSSHSDEIDSVEDARSYCVPPQWVVLVEELNRDVASIETKIADLQTTSSKHLLPTFGDDDDAENEERIAAAVQELSHLFSECQRKLKQVTSSRSTGKGDELVRKNIERRVAQQLQDLSLEFRRSHKSYLSSLKGQKIEDYQMDLSLTPAASSGATQSASQGFFDDEPAHDPIDPRFNSEQMLKIVVEEHMSKEREKAINQVAESVTELADIFKEIQVLVIDQGTVLDRIDFNIEQAADRVQNAVVELNKANEYQKKSKTMMCIYLLLLLCGIMIGILILKNAMK
mmetsp:Transcript_16329/g.48328  ORF Transcript_16329/g.48328 Transcript_16329/m.48328 type:complete len:350 (-) Transcript_16329:180-1229(-)